MTGLLVELIKETPKDQLGKVLNLLQGKLYPDYVGIELGVAEKTLTKAIAEVTGKSEQFVEIIYKKTGDLGLSVEQLLGKKSQSTLSQRNLTIETVYETFDKIAHLSGTGSAEKKLRYLISLLTDATPLDGKYIVRIAIGNLRLGVADMTILDALATAYGGGKEEAREPLERAYNLSSDLSHVANVVAQEGLEGILKFEITPGRPIRSMLCERLPTAEAILEKLGGEAAAEYKYDGLRVQAHLTRNGIHLFSRRLENITDQFPDVVKHLRESVKTEAIIEGECVAVDPQTGDMLPFQIISQRRGRKFEIEKMSEEIPLNMFLFDILFLQGRDMTQVPYLDRRKALIANVAKSDYVKVSEQFTVRDPKQIDELMDQAIAAGCEGLVIKSISKESIYQAGARGWLWIKYKRSYKAEVQDTVDLVPVGAFVGRGKRAGGYGALLMSVYNPKTDMFETLCKLGSGFTDQDVTTLPRLMKPYVIPKMHPRVSSLMKPDVWLLPTFVLEVAADEITLSPHHTCAVGAIRPNSGLALRFPRFTGNWRRDKSAEDATSTQETLEMYKKQLKQIESIENR